MHCYFYRWSKVNVNRASLSHYGLLKDFSLAYLGLWMKVIS